ncbi:MAG: CdvA-like protein [Thermoproteota archaeon]|nr:CdvA-like protein [Thermoproteota archaeon]
MYSMYSNEFSKYIGSRIINEFDETLGVLVGYTTDGIGEVKTVLIRSAIDIHEVSIDRIEKVSEDTFKLFGNIYYKYRNIEKKIKYVHTRIESINKFYDDNVNKEVFAQIKSKTEQSLKELLNELEILKNEILSRFEYLNNLQTKVDESIIELKLSYIENNIDKSNYESKLEHLLSTKNRISKEINYLNDILNQINNIDKSSIIEVKIVS